MVSVSSYRTNFLRNAVDIIIDQSEFENVCKKIDEQRRFAIDLEFIPERTFQPVICLVQIATDQEAFIVDPLAVKDLLPLWKRVADPSIATILHAAVQDLDLIFRASELIPQNIFDTQIAAGFSGFGYPTGYGKLLNQLLGITIAKSESFTDWLDRPLSASQIEYAIEDVCHLLPMADRLTEILAQMGRKEWVLEECELYSSADRYIRTTRQEFMKVKGANSLNRRSLGVLQCLCELRDQLAAKMDRPVRAVLSDTTLLELSRRPPKSLNDIQKVRGVRPDQVRSFGKQLIASIEQALALPSEQLPSWPSAKATPKREIVIGDLLYSVLKVIAFDADIATELVATRDEVQALVRIAREQRADSSDLSLLHGWRFNMAGKHLLDLLMDTHLVATFQLNNDPPVILNFETNGSQASDIPVLKELRSPSDVAE